jgi:hypothetical protein
MNGAMWSDDARRAVITAANESGMGNATVEEMWASLHSKLHDLCRVPHG